MVPRHLWLVGLAWLGIADGAVAQIQELRSGSGTISIQNRDGSTTIIDVASPLKLTAAGGPAIEGTSDNKSGLFGHGGSDGYGVSGEAGNIGVYAHNTTNDGNAAYLGARCCAADLYGNVQVRGTLTKAAGSFRIDHPLDPGGKYLNHSFVESPDMMNVYNGNVTLDEHGRATVRLPPWFEALNRDFRYQLTPLGAPAPNLYVAKEVSGNRFTIAGGAPGGRVSWQVTGIRHDAYANAHRIPVEENKPAEERGTYLFPELVGLTQAVSLRQALYGRPATVRFAASRAGR
jgi:hypothetical protein